MKIQLVCCQILIIYLYLTNLLARARDRKPIKDNILAEMKVVCQSDSILLNVQTNKPFNGMIYAKDVPSNSKCVSEYNSATNLTYRLPLKSCGTLFAEADDGIEYYNTIMVQPHIRLMTNQGKGYHIRCKYQTRERTIANTQFNVSASFLMADGQQAVSPPLIGTASMPSCTMKIFRSGRDDVADSVKIGDKLIMVIEIDQQDMYGIKITNCVVRDGMNMAQQQLIDDSGCPIDETIMPKFEYANNFTQAAVSFPAHKFPHTSSVYYQCNVRLCINANGGCEQTNCKGRNSANGSSFNEGALRKKRFSNHQEQIAQGSDDIESLPTPSALHAQQRPLGKKVDVSFDVYSGLNVSDNDAMDTQANLSALDSLMYPFHQVSSREKRANSDNLADQSQICTNVSQASLFVLAVCLCAVSVTLMLLCQLGMLGRDYPGDQKHRHLQTQNNKLFGSAGNQRYRERDRSMATTTSSRPWRDYRHYQNQYDTETMQR